MKDKRPKNLDLLTIHFPWPAITSILHRVSGVFIFAGVAVLLWLLSESLTSGDGFTRAAEWLDMLAVKLLVWAVLAGLLFHLIAGIKHLLMDIGIGESFKGGVLGAKLVIALSAIAILLSGAWLW